MTFYRFKENMNIHPKSKEAYQLLHDGTLALARAEQQGMRVDLDYCERKKTFLTRKITYLENQFYDSKFYRRWVHSIGNKKPNMNSNPQLAKYLYSTLKLEPASTTDSGQGATDEDALKQLGLPELDILLQVRKLKKLRDTYLDAFIREQVDGYVHPFFNLHLVRTFRSSSDRPNFQNIPKRDDMAKQITRRALFPRPGHQLVEIDFSGLEVRIAAAYHFDPTMLKYILDPTTDMHRDMAQQLFKVPKFDKSKPEHKYLRAAAKNGFVFPEFYGDYYKNCAKSLLIDWGKLPKGTWEAGQGVDMPGGIKLSDHLRKVKLYSMEDFTEHVREIEFDFWNNRFPVYNKWKDQWWAEYQKNGYVDMYTGFRCSGVMSRNDVINYPVQGAAFHCLLWALIKIDKKISQDALQSRIIGQIHDAIVLDVHPDERDLLIQLVQDIMCKQLSAAWTWINTPLEVEVDAGVVDASWAELEPYAVITAT